MKHIDRNNIVSISANTENANFPIENVLDLKPGRKYKTPTGEWASEIAADCTIGVSDIVVAGTNASQATVSVDDPNVFEFAPSKIGAGVNLGILSGAISSMASQRVDIIAMGDSNQVKDGTGWDHGWQYALDSLGYKQYATMLHSPYENEGNGSAIGYKLEMFALSNATTSGVPSDLEDAVLSDTPHNPGYYPLGATEMYTDSRGLVLSADSLIDVNANLTWEFYYGTFTTGSGQFKPSVRRNDSPYSAVIVGSLVSTNTGSYSIARQDVSVSADTRDYSMLGGFVTTAGSTDMTGPAFAAYIRVINDDRAAGWSYHSHLALGGMTARDMALCMQNRTDASLTHYYENLRRVQGTNKKIIFVINTGVNDRNETETSVGPSPVADGDSAAAYSDNIVAIIERIKEIWDLNSWVFEDEVVICVQASHSVASPEDSELLSYQSAAEDLVGTYSNLCTINLHDIIGYTEMLANDYYLLGGADVNHLTQSGYEGVSLASLEAVEDGYYAWIWYFGGDWEWGNVPLTVTGTATQDFINKCLWIELSESVNVPCELSIKLFGPSGEPLEVGVIQAGVSQTYGNRNPRYGLQKTQNDYSIAHQLSNGNTYYKLRNIARVFSASAIMTRANTRLMEQFFKRWGQRPTGWRLTDEGSNDFVVFGRVSGVSITDSYPNHSEINWTITEVL